jgi:AcrR family transcriptional regulator
MSNPISEPTLNCSGSRQKVPNRRERRRAETREKIIRAALDLFSERGMTATTIEDITNAADVGKGTFFNYFATKDHIMAHLCELQMGKIRELVAKAISSKESMESVMYRLAMTINEEFARNPALVRNILVPLFSGEVMRQQMADHLGKDRQILAELMHARQQRGEIRSDLSPEDLALNFQRVFFGTTVLWSLDPSKPLPVCLKDMSKALWSGMKSKSLKSKPKDDKSPQI